MTIYQLFCGRQADANILVHSGQVLKRMNSWPWPKLRRSGFTTIYLLGLIDHQGHIVVNEEQGLDLNTKNNRSASIFAVNDHRQIDPSLGTQTDLVELIETIHAADLQVIIDLIPNQTGLGHKWVSEHPEYYLKNPDGSPQKAFSQDVFLLDHTSERVRQDLWLTLKWIMSLKIDGVRCDMAHLAKPDLWPELISKIKEVNPHFIFIAEAYSNSVFDWSFFQPLLDSGFTAIYHEFLYRNLKWSLDQPRDLTKLTNHLNYVLDTGLALSLVHYLSNHDDPPVCSIKGLNEALFNLLVSLPGHILIYNGSLNGFDRRLAHHWIEVLPQEQSELYTMPKWFNNANQVKLALGLKVKEVRVVDHQIIESKLTSEKQSYRMWGNLADRPVEINFDQPITGLLHGLTSGDKLGAYQAEIWPEAFSK